MSASTLSRRAMLATTGAGVMAAMSGVPAQALDVPKPGAAAPEFTLNDSTGKPVTLASFKGTPVILEWTNHECPYVRKHYGAGNMQELQREAAAKGFAWLTVISSAPGTQGHVDGLEADQLTATRKAAPKAVLFDPTGVVGRRYGATATPNMYVIDKAGMLIYMGAIDDKPSTNPADIKGANNYVRAAMTAVLAGSTPAVRSTRAYGCSIKYAPVRS
ncbi:MAG TPA: thioredoxin family protein [Hyphomicrobiaceae bacterium]|nr:thioredoxin family protein [Hyphomicrobiaceae bacterium]